MRSSIDIERIDDVVMLRPSDEDLGPEQAEALKEAVRSLAGTLPKAVIVNFSLVEYLSSIFLSALVEILKELHGKKVRLGLAELNRKNLEIIMTTKLDRVLPIFSSVQDAIAALAGKRSE